jgi:hypothetical protein
MICFSYGRVYSADELWVPPAELFTPSVPQFRP